MRSTITLLLNYLLTYRALIQATDSLPNPTGVFSPRPSPAVRVTHGYVAASALNGPRLAFVITLDCPNGPLLSTRSDGDDDDDDDDVDRLRRDVKGVKDGKGCNE